jgi:hypothetical protein
MMAPTAVELPRRVDLPREGYTLFVKTKPGDNHGAYHPANDKGKPGLRCPGMSTIGGAFPDDKRGLMYWVESMSLEGVARLSAAQISVPSDPYALRGILEQRGLRWEQIRDKAAERGTNIHVRVLEALARGDEIPDLADLEPDEQGYGQAVFRWWEHRKPSPLQVEQEVLSVEYRCAGRFDLRCIIEAPTERCHGTGIVDLKTAKRPYASDHIQLRGYDIAARECGIGEQDWLMVLQVCPDGEYVEHYCAAEREDFMLALRSYEAKKRVDRAMKAAA